MPATKKTAAKDKKKVRRDSTIQQRGPQERKTAPLPRKRPREGDPPRESHPINQTKGVRRGLAQQKRWPCGGKRNRELFESDPEMHLWKVKGEKVHLPSMKDRPTQEKGHRTCGSFFPEQEFADGRQHRLGVCASQRGSKKERGRGRRKRNDEFTSEGGEARKTATTSARSFLQQKSALYQQAGSLSKKVRGR